jgi:protein ImuB
VLACVDLPAFPLQLAHRAEPALRAFPSVVIDEDRPNGLVQWACARARAAGVLPGQRYAQALASCKDLHARVMPPERIAAALEELRVALHACSPRVEVASTPGTMWLDGDGLARLIGTPSQWGIAIGRTLARFDVYGAVVVGMSRFATYAIARVRRGVSVLIDEADERATASAVPLARLEIDPKLRDALARLGVTRLGELVRLPAGGILERFGSDAHRLYELAAGERWDPLVPSTPPEVIEERVVLDDDLEDIEQLVFVLKPALASVLAKLGHKLHALTALHVELVLRRAVGDVIMRADCIKPASPTLDGELLVRLARLRLTGSPPGLPVHAVRVWAEHVLATREQLTLLAQRPRRDLRAGAEALARVRAELGDDAVVRPVLRDGHLPEASFGWEPVDHITHARPVPKLVKPLVRRVYARPRLLPPRARNLRDDGWLLARPEMGPVVSIDGPFIITGGWWSHHEVQRDYHYALMRRGDWLWIYYDRYRRRWFWHGIVD